MKNIDDIEELKLNQIIQTMDIQNAPQIATGSIVLNNQQKLIFMSNASQLTQYTKDIIPGQYQGGFKLWECTHDLANYMTTIPNIFQGKRVLQMGCGHGLLGILAYKLGAKQVCLQDYNMDVIQKLTKPTVALNCLSLQPFTFIYGDWSHLKREGEPFDVIIGSELIYNEQNYLKILAFLSEFMKQTGCSIMANKMYYFGVGGNMAGFRKSMELNSKLRCETVLKIVPEKGGNKKEIVKITY